MKADPKPVTARAARPQDWNADYWKQETHGSAWDRIKGALQRDWAQTKSDLKLKGGDLHQSAADTVKQAAGRERIPPVTVPNGGQPPSAPGDWKDAEAAVRYGFGAHEQYRGTYAAWNDDLETRLSTEWDEERTGKPYREVRSAVWIGWHGLA
jgi:hypothetical protein